jgi:deoxyribonuclease-2
METTNLLLKKQFVIKFPKGTNYIKYDNEQTLFVKDVDINIWLSNIYQYSEWKYWILYNDESDRIGYKHTKKGHCKGILTWDDNKIGWLCHSVPNFPRVFEGNKISTIEESELIYGQSFQYIEIPFTQTMINNIVNQIHIMDSNIFNKKYNETMINLIDSKNTAISKIIISDDIVHIAKSPLNKIDIYSDYIIKEYNYNWKVESWMRGHCIKTPCENIVDIKNLCFEDVNYTEKQDHSKWALSDNEYYWIGDLNRMKSQYKRGGGGFICKDINIVNALNKLLA